VTARHLPSDVRPNFQVPYLEALVCALGFVLFFLMIVVPTVYQPLKGVLLASVVAGIVWRVMRSGRLALHPLIVAGSAAFIALGLVFVLRGIWLGAPGAIRMSTVYVVWPVVYTVLIAGVSSERILRGLSRLLVAATIVISLYSLTYILWEVGWWPTALYIPLDQGQGFNAVGGTVEFNLYSISSLIFLVPFVTALVILRVAEADAGRRFSMWVALGLGLLVSILTGRRALLLVLAVAPLLAWSFRLLLRDRDSQQPLPARFRAAIVPIGVVLIGALIAPFAFGLRASAALQWFASGFRFSSDPIAMMRASQSAELLSGWWQSPWFGWGYGAIHPTLVRSVETPWAFELSYLALLFNTGAVGTFLYAIGLAFIFLAGFVMARSGHRLGRPLLAILVGTATFLIANATNPYLPKFDYEWVIFLPLAFINLWLLERDDRTVRVPSQTP
jgi:hypothetical protein